VDLKKDLLLVQYDGVKVSTKQMLEAIDKQGYDGKVVTDGTATK
jgi:hypothetical protein